MTTISRRRLLAGAAATPVAGGGAGDEADPMVGLCRAWHAAWEGSERRFAERTRLHRELVRRIGEARVAVGVGEGGRALYAWSADDLERMVAEPGERARLAAELAQRRARWDAEAAACGLDVAEALSEEADARMEAALQAVRAGSAASVRGVVGKLGVAVAFGAGEDDLPWDFLRGALADLRGMAGA